MFYSDSIKTFIYNIDTYNNSFVLLYFVPFAVS